MYSEEQYFIICDSIDGGKNRNKRFVLELYFKNFIVNGDSRFSTQSRSVYIKIVIAMVTLWLGTIF